MAEVVIADDKRFNIFPRIPNKQTVMGFGNDYVTLRSEDREDDNPTKID
jgi:hypothetical protein